MGSACSRQDNRAPINNQAPQSTLPSPRANCGFQEFQFHHATETELSRETLRQPGASSSQEDQKWEHCWEERDSQGVMEREEFEFPKYKASGSHQQSVLC